MRPRLDLVISIAVLAALLAWGGCGGQDLIVGGMLRATLTPAGTTTPTCLTAGDSCAQNADCCSGLCDFATDGQNLLCR